MAYLTSRQLKAYQAADSVRLSQSHAVTKAVADSSGTVVFLSHSHHDVDHVLAARHLLERYGANIYVDWEDGEMPTETSIETANLLKKKIGACDRFVMLASERSLKSRWVPWELGFAEGSKGLDTIAILPFVASMDWEGSEYVGIYPTIEPSKSRSTGEEGLSVFQAGKTIGDNLSNWLT